MCLLCISLSPCVVTNPFVLYTFANAHLALINGVDDLANARPIGALLMSMQVVRCTSPNGQCQTHLRLARHSNTGRPARKALLYLNSPRTTSMTYRKGTARTCKSSFAGR